MPNGDLISVACQRDVGIPFVRLRRVKELVRREAIVEDESMKQTPESMVPWARWLLAAAATGLLLPATHDAWADAPFQVVPGDRGFFEGWE